jgi:hypothetical protein
VTIRCGTELESNQKVKSSLPLGWLGCILLPMSFRPVRKIAGIGNVFMGRELVDIGSMISISTRKILKITSIMEPTGHPAKKIEGTVVGELPVRRDLKLVTEERYTVKFIYGTASVLS